MYLQRLDSSPLDLCCFSLHLCRLSPILTLLFRSLSLSRLIVSPLLTLLSFLDFSFVIHLTWSPHVTCDTCAESHSNDLVLWNDYALCAPSLTPERKVDRRVPTIPTSLHLFLYTSICFGHTYIYIYTYVYMHIHIHKHVCIYSLVYMPCKMTKEGFLQVE